MYERVQPCPLVEVAAQASVVNLRRDGRTWTSPAEPSAPTWGSQVGAGLDEKGEAYCARFAGRPDRSKRSQTTSCSRTDQIGSSP